MKKTMLGVWTAAGIGLAVVAAQAVPMHVTYLWHMHQPIYYPYESPQTIDANGRFNFSVQGVWDSDRVGAYTTWPKDAVQAGADKGMAHAGAQMSYSGSLAENNNNLWGYCTGNSWDDSIDWARNGLRTSLDNPRLDTVGIAYHHSLMPLTCKESMKMQIRLHKEQFKQLWDTSDYSKGFWPPECAFAEWMIPALVEEGLEWVIVDNGHLFRAVPDFPWSDASSCRVNPADMQNPTSAELGSTWVQLQNVWAPTKVLAPWAYQPHYVQHVDPASGTAQKIIAVPAGRYEGNENGRGGYGAFKPENVWGAHVGSVNTDANHPMLLLAHSDGDNYGMKNSDAWHGQHGLFLDMCNNNADFDHTSVQDYLEMYPPSASDVIHVEPGSWVGIDGGTPYFEKWLSSTYVSGENPDRWSWSVLVAAQNRVILADSLENSYLGDSPNMDDVEWGINNDTARAWHAYLNGETSCYWYWDMDRGNPWDGNVTRACNTAVYFANQVIGRHSGVDGMGPSIFPPQRNLYNPGGRMWNETEVASSDFEVWSYVDDVSGLSSVTLKYRADNDGVNPLDSVQNETFAGGSEVGSWNSLAMTNSWDPAVKGPDNIVPSPTCRAQKYTAPITGQSDVLIDYYVEAVDTKGNTNRSDIFHVYVGQFNSTNVVPVTFAPTLPDNCEGSTLVSIYNSAGRSLAAAASVTLIISFDGGATNEYAMSGTTGGQWYCTNGIPSNALSAKVMFRSGTTYDDNGGNGWGKTIQDCYVAPAVAFNPEAPDGCDPVKISYVPNDGPLSGADPVRIHIGYNGWQGVVTPDPAMTNNAGSWEYLYYPPVGCSRINACFNDGGSAWDNNNGQNYGVDVSNCVLTNVVVEFSPASPRDCDTVTVTFDPTNTPLQGTNPVYVTATFDAWATYAHYEMASQSGKWVYDTAIPEGALNLTVNFRSGTNGSPTVYDNAGANWSVAVSSCNTNTLVGIQFAEGSPAFLSGGSPNNAGDNFDFNTNGGAATVHSLGGFGDFGQIYANCDATNFYIGGVGADLSGSNNAMIVFLSFNTLGDNSWTLWNMNSQPPLGLDILHNVAFNPPADIAILLGDVYGDGTYTNFDMYSAGFQFGQGVYYLNSAGSNFWPLSAAQLAQFDGAGTVACTSTWDSGSRLMTRWKCAIPWGSLNASNGVDSVTNCSVSGLIVSSGVQTNDRYISSAYLGLSTTSATKDEYGNFGFNFVNLNGLPVDRPETYLYNVPVSWIRSVFGDSYDLTMVSDFDGDGRVDRDEYLAGTDPRDYLSHFTMQHMVESGGGIVLRWASVAGRTYSIERATNLLEEGGFTNFLGEVDATPPQNVYSNDQPGPDESFYRIKTGL